MVVVFVLCVKCERSSQVLMFYAAVEALTQGNSQQQFQYWHSSVCTRKNCVSSVSEKKFKSECLYESVFKCESVVIICVLCM